MLGYLLLLHYRYQAIGKSNYRYRRKITLIPSLIYCDANNCQSLRYEITDQINALKL